MFDKPLVGYLQKLYTRTLAMTSISSPSPLDQPRSPKKRQQELNKIQELEIEQLKKELEN
jgi:hypothetical protein